MSTRRTLRTTQKTRTSASKSQTAKRGRSASSLLGETQQARTVLKTRSASSKNKTISNRRLSAKVNEIGKSVSKSRTRRFTESIKDQQEKRAKTIKKNRMPNIAEEPDNPELAPRIPTKSGDILLQIFGKVPADFGELARDLTELQAPQTQGTNAYRLAEYIVSKGKSSTYYERALFFKKLYESNNCYICGLPIEKGNKQEELEHILPIGEALALTGIIQENSKDFKQKIEEIAEHPISYMYLLEYARSHTCCNQVKSHKSFLKFNGSPPFKQPYSIDENIIKKFLGDVWINAGHGGDLQQFPHACANANFVKNMGKLSKEQFIESRSKVIVRDFMTPILKNIESFVGNNGLKFAQLVYLANQAISVDEKVWRSLGTRWSGDIVEKDKMLFKVIENVKNDSYDMTREKVAEQLFELSKNNKEFRELLIVYYNSKKGDGRASRVPDINKFKSLINVDFLLFKELHQKYMSARTNEFELYYGSESMFGIEYFYYLLNSQNAKFKFFESMEDSMVKMLRNVNLYTVFYIMLFIIYYNPMVNGLPSSVRELDNAIIIKINEYGIVSYDMIHNNFINAVFQDFNYLVKPTGTNYYLNIQQLMSFAEHISMTPTEMEVADILIGLKKKARDEYTDIGNSL